MHPNREAGLIVFGIVNVLINFLPIGALSLMCRIDRGFSVAGDEKARRWGPLRSRPPHRGYETAHYRDLARCVIFVHTDAAIIGKDRTPLPYPL
jgi:hypothetical protein